MAVCVKGTVDQMHKVSVSEAAEGVEIEVEELSTPKINPCRAITAVLVAIRVGGSPFPGQQLTRKP